MNTFAQAIRNPSATQTENGMEALTHTGNELTDLFFNIGAARNNPNITVAFTRAWTSDPLLTAKILFWSRDVREGAGERDTFRRLLNELEQYAEYAIIKNIHLIPEFGRWDDLLTLKKPATRAAAFKLIAETLRNQRDGYQLCAKWMPRKGPDAIALRNAMNLSPRQYRKLLVHSTNVVETAMCAQDWTHINYEHVPSVAAKQYQQAFGRHDPQGYATYKEALTNGTAKINASAIFPHDIVNAVRRGDSDVASAQWDALPNFLGDDYILPVVDVSGSMDCPLGNKGSTTCMDAAIALGLYVATKQQGAFHNVFCTFSATPHLQVLNGKTLKENVREMEDADWGMNTNLEAVFNLVLSRAVEHNVPQNEMPKYILIMSDMQFDQCIDEPSFRAIDMIRHDYAASGYTIPKVVFWNMNGAYGNAPVAFNESGTALISGYSPAIMQAVLKCENITPWDVMISTIGSERYSEVKV